MASDGADHVFVADTGNSTIHQIDIATGVVTTLAGSKGIWGGADGTGLNARFSFPEGLAADGAGNLFVADTGASTIRQIKIATSVVTTLAGSAGKSGSFDGTGPSARFSQPGDLSLDNEGNLFVVDGSTVRKVAISTGAVTTIIGASDQKGIVLGPLPASLNAPAGVAFVPPAQLFITDAIENAVLVAQF